VPLPVREVRFSTLTSSPFTMGTGDAEVKVIDAKSAQARTKRARRDMEKKWIGWRKGRIVGQVG